MRRIILLPARPDESFSYDKNLSFFYVSMADLPKAIHAQIGGKVKGNSGHDSRSVRVERRLLPRRLVTANPAMREKTEASACPPTCPSKLERSWKPGEGWKRRLVQPGVWGLFGTCRAGGRRSNRAAFISLRRDKPARQARDECGIGVME